MTWIRASRRRCLVVAAAFAIGACGQAMPSPSELPSPSSLANPSAPAVVCIVQAIWEGHEGSLSGHWEAAHAAATSRDGLKGSGEALLAASEARAMANQAIGSNPVVVTHLLNVAAALQEAATAFNNGDFVVANSRIAEAQDEHELALGSTTAQDWC